MVDSQSNRARRLADAAMQGLHSALIERRRFGTRTGLSYPHPTTGVFRRDLYEVLGYNRDLLFRDYFSRYERGGVAERIIEAYPDACWSPHISLSENLEPSEPTDWEQKVRKLFKTHQIWDRLRRANILARIGEYGVLLIGAKGSPENPLPSSMSGDDILYLSPLAQDRAQILELEQDPRSPRFGLPKFYTILSSAPTRDPFQQIDRGSRDSSKTHWSRVIHIADGVLEDDIYGKPALRSVWNKLDDLDKITGGGAEAAWRRMDPGMQLDVDPEIELDDDEEAKLNEEVEEYLHGESRIMRTRGVKLSLLAATVAGFGPNSHAVLQQISGITKIPIRILVGSERGELASSQDRKNWDDRAGEYRDNLGERTLRDTVSRFTDHGVLPEVEEYHIQWPDIDELSESEKAKVVVSLAEANGRQADAEGVVIMPANEIRDRVYKINPLSENEEEPEEETDPDIPLNDDGDDNVVDFPDVGEVTLA